jgi:hypothetical protein
MPGVGAVEMPVLLISEDEDLRAQVQESLRESGITASPDTAGPKAIILDHGLPDFEARLRELEESDHAPIVLVATPEHRGSPPEGVAAIVFRPLRPGELEAQLRLLWRQALGRVMSRERLLAHAVESAGDIIEIATPNAVYEYVNPAFERVLGHKLEDVVGRTPASVIRSDMHEPGYFKRIDETLQAGKAWKGLLISRAKDGRLVYLEGTVAPVRDADGTISHHVAVKRDITARLEAENAIRRKSDELEQARDAALDASRSKSQFLANMSHELRTPLNAIIGYSEMLMEDATEEGMESMVADLRKILRAGEHLLELINDVLDISKIEAGAMKIHLETFELRTAVSGVVATIEPLAREHDNRLIVDLTDDIGVMRADLTKVRQTLLNLLSNACKFTDQGEVRLSVRTEAQTDGPVVIFEISDSGIGISPEQQRRLFRPFVQADASTTRKYGGTGLGLAISQRFCQMMGGRIEASSTVGEGSTFTVTLPQVVSDPEEEEPAPIVRRAGKGAPMVLVVDDDPTIRELLTRALDRHGFQVMTANDGKAGLARARELLPAAIVLDVMMPELDGWAVLTELKGDAATADIPVVLLTILEQSEVGFALGAVDYLVKPVQTDRLAAVLNRHCRLRSARILIVDDDADSRHLMRRFLETAGHAVAEASNGADGLESIEALRPDLVVLDLMMPIMDGFGVLDYMRQRDDLRQIPVVVVTAKTLTAEDRDLLVDAQAVYERGSLNRQELLDAVVEQVASLVAE